MQKSIACLLILMSTSVSAAEPASPPVSTSKPAAEKPATATSGSENASKDAQPAVQTSGQRRTNDRLDLDTTVVTGNRELPKVLYIVPWKKADIGDLPAQPFNTLLDEALTPVDRDVFRREVTYYGAVSSGGDKGSPASSSQPAGPEK
jgi:hypothetical protein